MFFGYRKKTTKEYMGFGVGHIWLCVPALTRAESRFLAFLYEEWFPALVVGR